MVGTVITKHFYHTTLSRTKKKKVKYITPDLQCIIVSTVEFVYNEIKKE